MPAAATPSWRRPAPAPQHPQLRVTNQERDQVVEQIQTAFAEGRLDKDEMDERLHLAMTARTYADLAPINRDLYGYRPDHVPAYVPAYVPPYIPAPPGYVAPVDPRDRLLGAAAHLLSLCGLLVVGPLAMLLVAGRTSPYIRRQAVESLNFHLTLLGATILLPLTVVGIALVPFIWVAGVVLTVVAGVSALAGGDFRYPMTLRPVK